MGITSTKRPKVRKRVQANEETNVLTETTQSDN